MERAELKCQSIAELEGFNRSLRRNKLIEFKALSVEDRDWQMQVSQLKSTYGDHLAAFSDRELKHLFVPEDPMDSYERSSWLGYPEFETPMLLSVWRRGAQGEQLRIHSFARDKTVYTVISAWPLSYTASADGIYIEITAYSDTSDEPFEKEVHLKVIDLT